MRRWLRRLRSLYYLTPATIYLVAVCFFVFSIQTLSAHVYFVYGYTFDKPLELCFALNWGLLKHGFFWQPITYALLHGNLFHLLMNMLVIVLFGAGVEMEVGGRRFLRIFFFGSILGGLGWLGLLALMPILPPMDAFAQWVPAAVRRWMPLAPLTREALDTAMCVGASGGVFALIGAYAAMFPNRTVYVLIPFPVKMRARTLAIFVGVATVIEAILIQTNVAYAAHLTGCLAGYAYGAVLRRKGFNDWTLRRDRRTMKCIVSIET